MTKSRLCTKSQSKRLNNCRPRDSPRKEGQTARGFLQGKDGMAVDMTPESLAAKAKARQNQLARHWLGPQGHKWFCAQATKQEHVCLGVECPQQCGIASEGREDPAGTEVEAGRQPEAKPERELQHRLCSIGLAKLAGVCGCMLPRCCMRGMVRRVITSNLQNRKGRVAVSDAQLSLKGGTKHACMQNCEENMLKGLLDLKPRTGLPEVARGRVFKRGQNARLRSLEEDNRAQGIELIKRKDLVSFNGQ